MQDNKQKTIMFPIKDQNTLVIRETLQSVYNSLKEKGYNPINQLVGYILTEDPTYITNYNNARAIISKIDRDELLRVLVENFLTL
ncbi:MAG TPA: IreB family regulatory phosphoprotein [Bacillota bacterium]|nr:IreB family regulatory phosphoprotein [Bacillota bacterium]HOK68600.1 IreB family regulatory phosphoprotein [Bacillota bacterium]HPP84796.1 IreB family regulatory phosphoprotein [Bacillota bacterium]